MDPHRRSPLDALDHWAASVHASRVHGAIRVEGVEQHGITSLGLVCNMALRTVRQLHASCLQLLRNGRIRPLAVVGEGGLTTLLHIRQIQQEGGKPELRTGCEQEAPRYSKGKEISTCAGCVQFRVLPHSTMHTSERDRSTARRCFACGCPTAKRAHPVPGTSYGHQTATHPTSAWSETKSAATHVPWRCLQSHSVHRTSDHRCSEAPVDPINTNQTFTPPTTCYNTRMGADGYRWVHAMGAA